MKLGDIVNFYNMADPTVRGTVIARTEDDTARYKHEPLLPLIRVGLFNGKEFYMRWACPEVLRLIRSEDEETRKYNVEAFYCAMCTQTELANLKFKEGLTK